jgi:hypothetical protein
MTTGMRPGEKVEDYVKRLEAGIAEQAKKATGALSFKLSDKGVIVASFGRGFPTSATVERWSAILESKDFAAFVKANAEKAKEQRKSYMQTPEYKTTAAQLNAERAAYSQKLKLA